MTLGWILAAEAIPKTLTHFTTQAGAAGIAQTGLRASSRGLFGAGRYASSIGAFPRNIWVRPAATIPVSINNTAGFYRSTPGTFVQPTLGGAVQLGVINAAYGVWVNLDKLDCPCK